MLAKEINISKHLMVADFGLLRRIKHYNKSLLPGHLSSTSKKKRISNVGVTKWHFKKKQRDLSKLLVSDWTECDTELKILFESEQLLRSQNHLRVTLHQSPQTP